LRRGVLCGLLLHLCGCGMGPNELSGSVSELFPLEVSAVEVLRNEHALQISYYNNRGAELDLVLRITVALADLELLPGRKLDLTGEYAPGHARTTVIHLPSGEPARLFPRLSQGDLQLRSGGEVDQPTRGDFSLAFEQSGGFGSGRTVKGTFDAVVLDAGYGDP
jgi:hypothetical protein